MSNAANPNIETYRTNLAMLDAFDDDLFDLSTVFFPQCDEVQSKGHFSYRAEKLAYALL